MRYLFQLFHLIKIYRVIVRYGLDELLLSTEILRPIRILLYLSPGFWLHTKNLSRGARLRLAMEELGPIFVKFGQILSTRRDLLPNDIALELAQLQDKVKPFNGEQAQRIVERAYNRPINEVFASFNPEPIAAASIAQVHAARLHNGREVVVKVVRPNLEKGIRRDVDLLYLIARLINHYWIDGRRLRPHEVVAEFEKNLYSELDLMQEAANCTQLRRNFHQSNLLYIPEIEWAYTQNNVMVMERISGLPVGDIATMHQLGVNFKYLAETGVEIFFTQVFRDNFFHADMHPGNVFVDTSNPNRPHYIAVDFGIMGTLSSQDQHYLAANFLAFFNRDYRRVAELHVHSGWVPEGTRVEEFEGAIRSVCEPIFDRPLKDISFGLLLLRLFQTARRFHMEVQPQLVLLQKTLLNIEGLGRELYPELDLWKTAKPYLERWMDERVGMRAFLKGIQANLPFWAEKMPEMPMLIYENIMQRQTEREQVKRLINEVSQLRESMGQQHEQRILLNTGSTLILGGCVILALQPFLLWNMSLLGGLLGIAGSGFLLLTWIQKR
ncbi:ubiquinone biosynthesis regulatory protein kinase UbiB [Beggiatoa leptomitoformis]|uniref:Probable protein kinase UbiB n=1 Tax=Beggiatoa leptomitoformis TaxID=288004 RepID=A0A2N9YGX1_9GAMM|nr:ubiquinone biosynthesis regulatory protein kinase UbiB [Beggiatoa leptomitoformis]ALG67973.1 ubiquinone biosynthesis regulatory protein kinase UbiB [Beggiatoa leptomitoformis]AUI69747.1 ubiquinone biosynthesis regulatory protein kinase UbiB [Beggiatoa leptomitoformis]